MKTYLLCFAFIASLGFSNARAADNPNDKDFQDWMDFTDSLNKATGRDFLCTDPNFTPRPNKTNNCKETHHFSIPVSVGTVSDEQFEKIDPILIGFWRYDHTICKSRTGSYERTSDHTKVQRSLTFRRDSYAIRDHHSTGDCGQFMATGVYKIDSVSAIDRQRIALTLYAQTSTTCTVFIGPFVRTLNISTNAFDGKPKDWSMTDLNTLDPDNKKIFKEWDDLFEYYRDGDFLVERYHINPRECSDYYLPVEGT